MGEELNRDELSFLADLSSPEAMKRLAAAEYFSGTTNREVVLPLINLLADEDMAVRSAARYALYEIGIKTEAEYDAILVLLEHAQTDVVLSVFRCITWLDRDERFVLHMSQIIIRLLAHHDREVRAEAAKFLIWIGIGLLRKWFESKGRKIDDAREMLLSANEIVRSQGIVVLSDFGLRGHTTDGTDVKRSVRIATAVASARLLKRPNRVEDEFEWKGSLGKTIGSLVFNPLQRGNESYQQNALQAQDIYLGVLLRLLKDPEADVREVAAVGLQQAADARSIKALLEALSDPDVRVRKHVLLTLGKIGSLDPHIITKFVSALYDPSVVVRRAASTALKMIGSQASIILQDILDVLSDEDTQVRQNLLEVVARIRPTTVNVVYHLLDLLKGSDRSTCMLVKMALIAILPHFINYEKADVVEDHLLSLPDEDFTLRNEVYKLLQREKEESGKKERKEKEDIVDI